MDASALSELIKAKVASLIQEHLKPVVSELAAQHQMLQTHSALLRYNHNVNDYQMGRLENLRDLEQSINFKVAGALAFDPWQHPTMGTNLREPVPADPSLIPHFTPGNKTPSQRATESAELIAQAGVSARRLGVPLTLHDFPRDPAIHCGGENEDPMHSAVPLFGLGAPRWRAKEGLPPDSTPGTATYNGVPAPPKGKKGRKLYAKKAQKMKPKWKTFEDATAPRGSSSRTSSSFDKLFELLDSPAIAGPSGSGGIPAMGEEASTSGVTNTPGSGSATPTSSSSAPLVSSAPLAPAPLASTSTITPLQSPVLPPVPVPSPVLPPVPTSSPAVPPPPTPIPALPPAPAPIPPPVLIPTPIPTASTIALSASSTFETRITSTSTVNFITSDVTQAASSGSASQSDSQHNEQNRPATPIALSFTSTTPPPMQVPPSLKRTLRDAGFEEDEDDNGSSNYDAAPQTRTCPEPHIKQEPEEPESGTHLEPGEPHSQRQRKRRRRSAAPSPSPSIGLGVNARGGWPGPGQLRRSTRVARSNAHATAMPAPAPATRKRQSGKRASTRSRH